MSIMIRAATTTSREDIRSAVQTAVDGSTALSGMVEIVELTDGTLQARSLVSDDGGSSTFNVNIEGPVATETLINDTVPATSGLVVRMSPLVPVIPVGRCCKLSRR